MKRVRVTEQSLKEIGFEKRSNMYVKGGKSIYLVRGHTWEYMKVGQRVGKTVKYIDEIK